MDNVYAFIPKKTFFLALALLGAIIILGLILLFSQSESTSTDTPLLPVISQSPSRISSQQKTIIGKTTLEELVQEHPETQEQSLPNGNQGYTIASPLDARPDQVEFKNRVAIFERAVVLGNLKIPELILKYGQAEKIIKGSKFYGDHMENHLYPSKGLMFIGNPNTNEVFEIQTFTPTTIEDYLNSYGEDIGYSEGREVKE